jgi:signal transduction histidine kinase
MDSASAEVEVRRWIHDHVIRLLERAAAGKLTPDDRRMCAAAASSLRREVLGDDRPHAASVEEAVDNLRLRAAELGLAVTIYDAIGPYPPDAEVVSRIFAAAETLLANVEKHVESNDVIVTVKASPIELRVTITDRGQGFDASKAQWSPVTQSVVFDALERIGARAWIDDRGQDHGTRWILRWRGEPD